jgi:hypothetical protein
MTPKDNPFSPLGISPLGLSPFGPAPPGNAAALEILKPVLEMNRHFSQAEKDRLWSAVFHFGEVIGEILNLFRETERDAEHHAHLNAALKSAAKYGITVPDHHSAKISELKQKQLITLITLACLYFADAQSVSPAAVERLRDKLAKHLKERGAAHARAAKAVASKRVDDLISHHAIRKLQEKKHAKKKRKPTAYRLADEIQDKLNADLKKDDLKKLGVKEDPVTGDIELDISAIAKRIRKLKILDR